MAEKQCNLLKNGGGMKAYRVIATANANQTFGQQLSYLKSYYNALTDGEKAASIMLLPRGTYNEQYTHYGNGYSRTWLHDGGSIGLSLVSFEMTTSKAYQVYSTTYSDITSSNNGTILQLCVLV